ncbi:MAG TPA: hypothetical protein PLI17_18095, partial [Denitromonas sp.]|nr:hypothetical protein [Denitromonas sp.]
MVLVNIQQVAVCSSFAAARGSELYALATVRIKHFQLLTKEYVGRAVKSSAAVVMIRAGCVVLPSGDTSSNPEMADVFQTMTNRNLQVLRVRYLDGPNIWTYRPVIEAWVDIHDLEDAPSNLIPGLYERLIAWLPGLIEHRCGIGERGGFLERLSEGTWAAHILEHVVIELHGMAGVPEGFGKARMTPERGIYKVAF